MVKVQRFLTSLGTDGDDAYLPGEVPHPVEAFRFKTLLVENSHQFVDLVVKSNLYLGVLFVVSLAEWFFFVDMPARYPIYLVGTHHEGGLVHFKDVKGLVGLGFEALVEVYHQHSQVS